MRRSIFTCLSAAAVLLLASASAQYVRINPEECSVMPAFGSQIPESTIGDVTRCSDEDSCSYKIQVANHFTIDYEPGYKVVRNLFDNPTEVHVLYPCGTEKPSPLLFAEEEGEVQYMEIPLTAVAVSDSTASWYLELLGVSDRVRFASRYSTSPCLIKLATNDATAGGCPGRMYDEFGEDTPEPEEFDALITYTGSNVLGKEIAFTASNDPGVLNRVEWLLYLAAFFNKEAEAVEQYNKISAAYNALLSYPSPGAPTVLWLSYATQLYSVTDADDNEVTGPGFVISFSQFKLDLTADAGANSPAQADWEAATTFKVENRQPGNVIFAPGPGETMDNVRELVKPLLKQIDIVIDETYFFSQPADFVADFMANWGISEAEKADFPFLANDQLWRHDKDQTVSGADDWFGEGIVRPDVVLRDLRAVVEPETKGDHTLEFFRNVALSEEQTFVGVEECSTLTCESYSLQALINPLQPASAVDDESEGNGVHALGTSATLMAACALGAALFA